MRNLSLFNQTMLVVEILVGGGEILEEGDIGRFREEGFGWRSTHLSYQWGWAMEAHLERV